MYCSNEDETAGFLNVFDKKGELIKEISLPFSRVSVSNGIVYGYYDETADFNGWILISRIVILKHPLY